MEAERTVYCACILQVSADSLKGNTPKIVRHNVLILLDLTRLRRKTAAIKQWRIPFAIISKGRHRHHQLRLRLLSDQGFRCCDGPIWEELSGKKLHKVDSRGAPGSAAGQK